MLAGELGRTITDGDWELFDYEPASGRSVWMMEDKMTGAVTFRTDYPVTALINANEQARNEAGKAWGGDWHRVASIPLNVLYDEKTGLDKAFTEGDKAFTSKWLNDSDNRAWRTKEGRV